MDRGGLWPRRRCDVRGWKGAMTLARFRSTALGNENLELRDASESVLARAADVSPLETGERCVIGKTRGYVALQFGARTRRPFFGIVDSLSPSSDRSRWALGRVLTNIVSLA